MCYFITAVLPQHADVEAIQKIAPHYHRLWQELDSQGISPKLSATEDYYATTRGMCDCGTELGLENAHSEDEKSDFDRQVKKLARKGWSGAKIERWLQDKIKADAKRRCSNFPRPSAQEWAKFLREILAGPAGRVGILLHFYNGPLTEKIAVSRVSATLTALTADYLRQIEEDQLIFFVR